MEMIQTYQESPRPPRTVTALLNAVRTGEPHAFNRLMTRVYDELRRMAQQQLRHERPAHTLNPTALVNEFYLKLVQRDQFHATHRTEFLAIAGRTMRRILVDYARAKKRLKRGGGEAPVPLDEADTFMTAQEADEVLALDEALDRLVKMNERASEVIQYRFYSGLTLDETAAVLGVSIKTVQRDWLSARAWLRKEVRADLGL